MWINNTYKIIADFYSFIESSNNDVNNVKVYPEINDFLKSIFGVKEQHRNFIAYKNSHLLLYMFYSKNSYNSAFNNDETKLEFSTYRKILDIAFKKDNFLKCQNGKAIKINDNPDNNGYIKINSGKDYDNFNV